LSWDTHAPPKTVIDLYTSVEWRNLCSKVLKLRLEPRPAPEVRGADEGAMRVAFRKLPSIDQLS
jgi:hypothetical protein